MRTAPFQDVIDRICALIGVPQSQLSAADQAHVFAFADEGTEQVWEFYWWPELMRSELRLYRDQYDPAKTYAAGDEIYYAATDLYYRALVTTLNHLPTNPTFWEVATSLDAYIELEQAGQTVIGEVRSVSAQNPMTTPCHRRIRFVLGEHGIHLANNEAPKSVYVWFRLPASDYAGPVFDPTATYAAGNVVYFVNAAPGFEGDFWTATAATVAAESPLTTPGSWAKIEFPKILVEAVAREAHYRYLVKDGAAIEQLGLAGRDAAAALTQAMHKIVGQQSQATRR